MPEPATSAMTADETAALAELLDMVAGGFDQDRFARLLNRGPAAVSDAVWTGLEAEVDERHARAIEQRENLAILMIEVDLARRLVVARRKVDPRITNPFEANRTAAFHAMERGAAMEASGPEAVLWFQAASVFFDKTGEPLFQADALSALAGCLHDTLHGDVAANLAQADEILDFAKARILSAPRPAGSEHSLPEAALGRLAWIAFRRALFAFRQSRFVGPDPERISTLLLEAARFAAPCREAEELHEEIRALALHQGILSHVDLVLASERGGGVAEQRMQRDLVEALSAPSLSPVSYHTLLERIDDFTATGGCGPLSLSELHILRAQIIMMHQPGSAVADRNRTALADLDIVLAEQGHISRTGRGARLAALRFRAVARAQTGSFDAALDDMERLVDESEHAAREARTAAGIRGSVEHLRALSGFAVRIGITAGCPERGLAIADACRAVGLRVLRGAGSKGEGRLRHSDLVAGIARDAAAVSLVPTDEGLVAFVTLAGREVYVDGDTIGLIAEGSRTAVGALSARWAEAYRTMLVTLAPRRSIDHVAWADASDALGAILQELACTVAGPLARMLERIGLAPDTSVSLILHGDLAQLPLHAAGRLTTEGWRCPLDRYAVSYAPSVDFLARSGSRRPSIGIGDHVLGIFNPTGDLGEGMDSERQAVSRAVTGQAMVALESSDATVAAISAAVPGARAIHFAGHGSFDAQFPGRSGLRLADGILELDDIVARLDLAGCEMIFLSACETSMNDGANLPDEVVGLPNALLSAGCACVIGAAWAVPSDFAAAFAADFYGRLEGGGQRLDLALRDAVRHARDGGVPQSGRLRRLQSEEMELEPANQNVMVASPLTWASFSLYGVPAEW